MADEIIDLASERARRRDRIVFRVEEAHPLDPIYGAMRFLTTLSDVLSRPEGYSRYREGEERHAALVSMIEEVRDELKSYAKEQENDGRHNS